MEEKQGKSKKGMYIALAALVLVLVAFVTLYFVMKPKPGENFAPIDLTVTVVHQDGSSKPFALHTKKQFLGDALVEGKVVVDNQSTYGLYILTADGETADEAKEEWWCITKGGQATMLGAGEQPIAAGEQYELTLTTGYGS